MNYRFYDSKASIYMVVPPDKFRFILKHHIKGLVNVDNRIIKIDLGDPLKNIYLNYTDITLPVSDGIISLLSTLNDWITNCVCCDCSASAPPPAA